MAKKSTKRAVLVGNKSYGLYIGFTEDTHAQIVESESIRVTDCRHVSQWFGKTGGITSLAMHGPCGPKMHQSRVGAAVPGESTLMGVVNVFPLTPEAIAAFDAIKPS